MAKRFLIVLLVFGVILAGCAKTEDFSTPSESWSAPVIVSSQNPDAVEMTFDDGQLKFKINANESYVYSFLSANVRKNVAIETTLINNGNQTNNAAILCRVDKEQSSWYEFHVANSGTYGLLKYDKSLRDQGKNPWVTLVKTSSSKLISSFKPNTIRVVCNGTRLTLSVNGTQLIDKENGDLTDAGGVGLGAIAYDAMPVVLGYDDVKISAP
jgi:hypothetical protein